MKKVVVGTGLVLLATMWYRKQQRRQATPFQITVNRLGHSSITAEHVPGIPLWRYVEHPPLLPDDPVGLAEMMEALNEASWWSEYRMKEDLDPRVASLLLQTVQNHDRMT